MITLNEIVLYLKAYDKPYNGLEDSETIRDVIKKLYENLKEYPDFKFRLKGAYQLKDFATESYDLFYINDMVILKRLLDERKYYSFVHEVYDFLNFKILKDNIDEDFTELPVNIKQALIYIIETSFIEIW